MLYFHSFFQDEATAVASHSKAVKDEHKLDISFISARSKHESALTELKAKEEAVIITRRHAGEQNRLLEEKQKDIDHYREKKAVDDVSVSLSLLVNVTKSPRLNPAQEGGET